MLNALFFYLPLLSFSLYPRSCHSSNLKVRFNNTEKVIAPSLRLMSFGRHDLPSNLDQNPFSLGKKSPRIFDVIPLVLLFCPQEVILSLEPLNPPFSKSHTKLNRWRGNKGNSHNNVTFVHLNPPLSGWFSLLLHLLLLLSRDYFFLSLLKISPNSTPNSLAHIWPMLSLLMSTFEIVKDRLKVLFLGSRGLGSIVDDHARGWGCSSSKRYHYNITQPKRDYTWWVH